MVLFPGAEQLAFTLSGGAVGSSGQTGGRGQGPNVLQGPLTLGPGQTAIPFRTQTRDTITFGSGRSARTIGASRIAQSPFFRTRSVGQASQDFFQRQPGGELVSGSPGAADLLRQLTQGFLPTLRPAGQAPARSEATGFAPGAIGDVAPGFGAASGLSPLVIAGIGAAGVGLLFFLLRR